MTDMEKWEHGKVSCFIQQDILRIIPKRIVPDELDSKDEVELIEDEVIDEIESKQLKWQIKLILFEFWENWTFVTKHAAILSKQCNFSNNKTIYSKPCLWLKWYAFKR